MKVLENVVKHLSFLFVVTGVLVSAQQAYSQGTTTVYKIKNPDGSVSYSDQPESNAEVMQVEPISTVPALRMEDVSDVSRERAAESKAIYSAFEITSPGHDTAFYSGNGQLSVTTKLTPALKRGHQYQFRLDGQTISTQKSGALVIPLVHRGTHTLSVAVLDQNLKTLISAASTFTIHRPKISRPAN